MDLVIGGGTIGRALYYHLRRFGDAKLLTYRNLGDVPKASVAYLCFGVTKTVECEDNPFYARQINVDETVRLSQEFPYSVWISSERVFNGSLPDRKKTDEVTPTTEYGRQKVETENELLDMNVGVIRFAKVLGFNEPLFDGWIDDLSNDKVIRPYSNMAMAPISTPTAVKTLREMGSERMTGLYQLSGDRDVSYDRIARFICDYMNKDIKLVKPVEAPKVHMNTTLESDFDRPDSWDVIYRWISGKNITLR